MLGVGRLDHPVSSPRVFIPEAEGFQIHWAKLPLAKRIFNAGLEAPLLLLLSNFEPIFDEGNPGIHHVLFGGGAKFEELGGTCSSLAKSHDTFDTGPVVPAAVEDHDLPSGGKVRDIALHVQLSFLAIRRGW